MSPISPNVPTTPHASFVKGPVAAAAAGAYGGASSAGAAGVGESDIRLFRHSRRQRWGIAALLWERDGKRGYQFSDGKLRVFKEGFYHLFETAAPPGDGSAKAVRRLARLARADGLTEAACLPTLRDQILLFRRSFPEGFHGKDWMSKHRGVGARRRLKRHRDPAISEAHRISAEELQPVIECRDWEAVHERLVTVAGCSNLVPGAQLKHLNKLQPTRELALALFEWVSGHEDEAELDRRFNHLVRLLGPAATWPTVTAIAALIDPDNHTCVRPSVFGIQAKMLLPNFSLDRRPRYTGYQRYVHVAKIVFDELESAGLQPRDLLDVYDFIWETLRPAAREELIHQHELPPLAPIEAKQARAEAA